MEVYVEISMYLAMKHMASREISMCGDPQHLGYRLNTTTL